MKLYTSNNNLLSPITSAAILKEKELQSLVEQNMKVLFKLEFVKSEFKVLNFRIDTLAYDTESRAFVIIEYKKERNFSVIDQGYTYMSLMLNNKADFIIEYNESCKNNLRRDDIDWSQSKVIFVSPHFTDYQKHSINFKNVPFELWEVKKYENNLFSFDRHKPTSLESITTIDTKTEKSVVENVTREVKIYSEEQHINKVKHKNDEVVELYHTLKERIMEIGEVEIVPRLDYICFARKTNFIDIAFQSKNLLTWLNLKRGELDDPKKLTRDVKEIGHHGNGDYELKIYPDTDLDYVMFLIKQSYKRQD